MRISGEKSEFFKDLVELDEFSWPEAGHACPRGHSDSEVGAARNGLARHGMARHGAARPGPARPGPARHDPARQGTARLGPARSGPARPGTARLLLLGPSGEAVAGP